MFQLDETEAATLSGSESLSVREATARFGRHDEQLDQIFKTLRQLIAPPARPKRPVGFRPPDDDR